LPGLLAAAVAMLTMSLGQWPDELRGIIYYIFGTAGGFMILVAVLGFAREQLNRRNRALDYLAESALPVYILHQASIVVPGWYIIHLPLPMPARIALLLVTSVAVTLFTYHFLIRPFSITRRLTGMKPRTN
jgi:glucans biosynthesis protein C